MIVYPFSFIKSVGSSLDPDAAAFLTAIGNTDQTIESAINTMVIDLKSYGLWTKLNVIYPFVGGTATSNKYNLKDPRDLDAAFRLTFHGGINHTNGFNPNGSNGYAQTYYIPSSNTSTNNEHISLYSNTNNNPTAGDPVDMGVISSSLQTSSLMGWTSSNFFARFNDAVIQGVNSTGAGFFVTEKSSFRNANLYKNGSLFYAGASEGNASSLEIYLATLNYQGNPYSAGYTKQNYCFASAGLGLTATDNTNLYSVVQACQTTLGRQA